MKHSKSGLFLMEMIVCILFFSLSAAVCAQMFAKSHSISENNINENHAVIISAGIAECFYAEFGDEVKINDLYYEGKGELQGGILSLYFDTDYNLCDNTSAPYKATLSVAPSVTDGMLDGVITFYAMNKNTDSEKSTPVYTLTLQVNNPNHI